MSRKYNLGKKSDMRRFERDLKNQILSAAKQEMRKGSYDIACPHCNTKISANVGRNTCPHCGNTVDLTLNFTS